MGAFPVSPAVYGGPPAPILLESLDCEVFGGSEDDGPLEGELPDRLIDCRFGSFALTPVASPRRLVGVLCDGECVLCLYSDLSHRIWDQVVSYLKGMDVLRS